MKWLAVRSLMRKILANNSSLIVNSDYVLVKIVRYLAIRKTGSAILIVDTTVLAM